MAKFKVGDYVSCYTPETRYHPIKGMIIGVFNALSSWPYEVQVDSIAVELYSENELTLLTGNEREKVKEYFDMIELSGYEV